MSDSTPEKWVVIDSGGRVMLKAAGEPQIICTLETVPLKISPKIRARADLIAAAPKTKEQRDALWEALRRAQWLLRKHKVKDGLFEALRTTAGLPTELEQCEELLEVFAKATEKRT